MSDHSLHEHNHSHSHVENPCDGEGHRHHHHDDGSCYCEHHAKEFHGIDRPMLFRMIVALAVYIAGMILPISETFEIILTIAATLIAGYDILLGAGKNLLRGKVFDEYFLMTIVAIAAFAIGEYEEGAAVILLYRIGSFLQSCAIRYSRRTIYDITNEIDDGAEHTGRVAFITRFARIYTPTVLSAAIIIVILLPLLQKTSTVNDAIYRALSFLVLACPCAIVISVPLAYSAGIGSAARQGIYFRNSEVIDYVADKKSPTLVLQHEMPENLRVFGNDEMNVCVAVKGECNLNTVTKIARRTHRVAAENIWITILIKIAVIVLSALGISSLWFAVFADSGITILTALNALRAFQIRKVSS